jgi:hypothetical protein
MLGHGLRLTKSTSLNLNDLFVKEVPFGSDSIEFNYISNKINSITYFSIKSIESDPIGYVKIRKSVTYGTEPVRLHAAQYATLLTPYRATALMIAPYGLAAKNIYFPLEFKGG